MNVSKPKKSAKKQKTEDHQAKGNKGLDTPQGQQSRAAGNQSPITIHPTVQALILHLCASPSDPRDMPLPYLQSLMQLVGKVCEAGKEPLAAHLCFFQATVFECRYQGLQVEPGIYNNVGEETQRLADSHKRERDNRPLVLNRRVANRLVATTATASSSSVLSPFIETSSQSPLAKPHPDILNGEKPSKLFNAKDISSEGIAADSVPKTSPTVKRANETVEKQNCTEVEKQNCTEVEKQNCTAVEKQNCTAVENQNSAAGGKNEEESLQTPGRLLADFEKWGKEQGVDFAFLSETLELEGGNRSCGRSIAARMLTHAIQILGTNDYARGATRTVFTNPRRLYDALEEVDKIWEQQAQLEPLDQEKRIRGLVAGAFTIFCFETLVLSSPIV